MMNANIKIAVYSELMYVDSEQFKLELLSLVDVCKNKYGRDFGFEGFVLTAR